MIVEAPEGSTSTSQAHSHLKVWSTVYRPLRTRLELYRFVLDLNRRGVTYNKMQKMIFQKYGTKLSKASISQWIRGIHHPWGSLNQFSLKSSPELAYVIGAILSDGNLHNHGYAHEMMLSVKDSDFARAFGKCLAKILSKRKPYGIHWSDKRGRWTVQGSSLILYDFLNRDWHELKNSIEHCEKCKAAFLRAFFDGEGSITRRKLSVYNTDLQLLLYVKSLLGSLGIETLAPRVSSPANTILKDPSTGKAYRTRKDCYQMHLRRKALPIFQKHVGFTISRKQQVLEGVREKSRPLSMVSGVTYVEGGPGGI
jgi:intein-encoded DNA endonuclease-like protein